MSTDIEELITALLTTIARLHLRLAQKATDLEKSPGVIGSHCGIEIGETVFDDEEKLPGEGIAGLHIDAYVDADLADGEIALWKLEAYRREGPGWEVQRELLIDQEPAEEFQTVRCGDSREFTGALPGLVEELLGTNPRGVR